MPSTERTQPMPAGNPHLTSNTAGGLKPQLCPDVRQAAADYLKYHKNMTPLVLRAVPEHGSPPLSAVEIATAVKVGARSTVRSLLCKMVKVGLAVVESVPSKRGQRKNVYVRAPMLAPDDYELAREFYGDADE